ncbi:RNA polymerase sigma factor [Pedobacter sp. MW01-1-1]|uniref:RNA polymerase sigma factor n=1 Tax=Pedobacter sp. MW01-1-1 TaxID=3383027 RepID=UPI003FF074EF
MNPNIVKDDQYWITEFNSGSNEGLAYFFELFHRPLCHFVNNILADSDEAEDIVADCFLKLWKKRNDFSEQQHIKAFLYIAAKNACLNYLQHLKVRSSSQEQLLLQLGSTEDTIVNSIIKSEILQSIYREIEELPDKMKEIFKLIYFENESTDKIADKLGLSVQTVRNQKTKAIQLLKNSLLKKGLSSAVISSFFFFIK